MSYDYLTAMQRRVVEALLEICYTPCMPGKKDTKGRFRSKHHVKTLAQQFGVTEHTMKARLRSIYAKYGIGVDRRAPFLSMIRLVYLHAKELGLLAICLFVMGLTCQAQAATRPIVLAWTASTSASVTGYSLYVCTSTTSTPCVPSTTGAPSLTFTSSATNGVYTGTVGLFYSFVLIANAPACSGTSPIGQACGNSAPVAFNPNPVPVPPQVSGATAVTSSVP